MSSPRPAKSANAQHRNSTAVQTVSKQNQTARSSVGWWSILAVLSVVIYGAGAYLDAIKHNWYIFDPSELHQLASQSVSLYSGQPNATTQIIDNIVTNLVAKHGTKHINTNQKEWMFNNAGGAMGAMYILHASITEYIIIFGTPLGTEGHSGRHTVDNYFNILVGEEWSFPAGSLEKEVYPPGSVHHLPRGVVKQYKMPDTCWALEYSRGWIPPMLPFGFADAFFSTLDFGTLWNTVVFTAREMIRNLLAGKI